MASRSPFLAKAIRLGLIGTGATAIMSAVVGMIAAFQLIEPGDEQSLGITRNEVVGWYAILIVIGLLLAWLGFRRRA
ncbi:MAG: hypothetical protein HY736_14040 [Verrucomicrobia bacterium]|nr:hypothetical protein [Verrucomicrobiota bacterium]